MRRSANVAQTRRYLTRCHYLIGLKHPHRHLFHDIAWSTERVYRQTAERAASIGLELVTLPAWYDVDDAASLSWLCRELLDGRRPPQCIRDGYSASQTREYLRGLTDGHRSDAADADGGWPVASTLRLRRLYHSRSGDSRLTSAHALGVCGQRPCGRRCGGKRGLTKCRRLAQPTRELF